MELLFLGSGSVLPEPDRDTVCLLINGRHLVDTGWWAARQLQRFGRSPLDLRTIAFTHFHHDHYLGLPQLLGVIGMTRPPGSDPLRLLGPGEHLETIVQASCSLLQWDRFPEMRIPLELTPLNAGETVDLGDVILKAIDARHVSGKGAAEPARALRFEDKETRAAVVYSGDTSFNPDLAAFTRGARVLIHDAAHSRPLEAARTALDAGVEALYLVHHNRAGSESRLAEAAAVFPASHLAVDGEVLSI